MTVLTPVEGHEITVTAGVFGRGYFDCSCGAAVVRGSKWDATRSALQHFHDVLGGCLCPPEVVELGCHPPAPP